MTDIGELVKPPEVDTDEVKCPFDHSNADPPTVENAFIGVGTTLARKMKNGEGTFLYAPLKKSVTEIPNPKDDPKHNFFRENSSKGRVVVIRDQEFVHTYPVTCAAHHCIPAQESLKDSPLLAFMVKKGASEPVKDGSFSDGVVWSDVGFDVNGSQNGVFLPGSYAVGGGRGGMGVWDSNEDGDEDKPEDAVDAVADPDSNMLTGALNEIKGTNRKWQYVRQAVRLCPGQFHDRHVDFSLFVQGVLRKMFENYNALADSMIDESHCEECKKRSQKIQDLGIPTPYGLVQRLNALSSRLKVFLNGSTWRINIFTSKWGLAYMEAIKAKNPDAD